MDKLNVNVASSKENTMNNSREVKLKNAVVVLQDISKMNKLGLTVNISSYKENTVNNTREVVDTRDMKLNNAVVVLQDISKMNKLSVNIASSKENKNEPKLANSLKRCLKDISNQRFLNLTKSKRLKRNDPFNCVVQLVELKLDLTMESPRAESFSENEVLQSNSSIAYTGTRLKHYPRNNSFNTGSRNALTTTKRKCLNKKARLPLSVKFQQTSIPTPEGHFIPQEIFGDAMMIYQFLETFRDILDTSKYLMKKVTLGMVGKILLDDKSHDMLSSLINLLIDAAYTGLKTNYKEKWLPVIMKHHWKEIKQMPRDFCTLSEILRLHLLISRSRSDVVLANLDQKKDATTLLKKMSLYELTPKEKAAVINELIHRLLSLRHFERFATCQRLLTRHLRSILQTIISLAHFPETDVIVTYLLSNRAFISLGKIDRRLLRVPKKLVRPNEVEVVQATLEETIETSILKEVLERDGAQAVLSTVAAQLSMKLQEAKDAVKRKCLRTVLSNINQLKKFPVTDAIVTYFLSKRDIISLSEIDSRLNLVTVQSGLNAANSLKHYKVVSVTYESRVLKKIFTKVRGPKVLKRIETQLIRYLKKIKGDFCLGQDSQSRCYWLFQSLPFLVAEDPLAGIPHSVLTSDSCSESAPQLSTVNNSCTDSAGGAMKWTILNDEKKFDELMKNLCSKRLPESHLKRQLAFEKPGLFPSMDSCPELSEGNGLPEEKTSKCTSEGPRLVQERLEEAVIDKLIEIEEKLNSGYLGGMRKSRHHWVTSLVEKNYEKFLRDTVSLENTPRVVAVYVNALLQLKRGIRPSSFCLYFDEGSRNPKDIHWQMKCWETYASDAQSLSQVYFCLLLLDKCMRWTSSLRQVVCKICLSAEFENMLICDICESGYHVPCLKKRLKRNPFGYRYCDKCRMEKQQSAKKCPHVTIEN